MIALYIGVAVIMCALGAFGSFFLKKALNFDNIQALIVNYNFYLGGFLYAASAVINIYLLRVLPYSVVLPLTSITYIFTLLISKFILKEKLTIGKIIGISLIITGIIFLIV